MSPFIHHCRKCKLTYSDRKQLGGHHSQKDTSKLLGMGIMSTVVVVMVSESETSVTTWQTEHLKCMHFI